MDPAFHVVTQRFFPSGSADAGDTVGSLSQDDPLEEETATYSSIFSWRTP